MVQQHVKLSFSERFGELARFEVFAACAHRATAVTAIQRVGVIFGIAIFSLVVHVCPVHLDFEQVAQ